jgi:glycolate oxidase
VDNYRKLNLPSETAALLLIEVDGTPTAVKEQEQRVAEICRSQGSFRIDRAANAQEAEDLWEVRRAISPSLLQLNLTKINEDVVVPRSKIPQLIRHIEAIKETHKLEIINFGHAGDGNIHVNVLYQEIGPREKEKAYEAIKEIFQKVLDLGGTISGEHGVGTAKAPFLSMELQNHEIELMKKIKRAFDPLDILNPGKMFCGSENSHEQADR